MLKVYVATVIAWGTLFIVGGCVLAAAWPYPWQWYVMVLMVVLCVAGERLQLQLHSGYSTAAGTIPHIATAFLFPPGVAALVAAIGMTIHGISRGHGNVVKLLFNAASVALAVGGAAAIATALGGPRLLSINTGWVGPGAALVASVAYHLISGTSVAVAVALDQRRSFASVVRGKFAVYTVSEIGLGFLGAILAIVVLVDPFWTAALVLPATLMYRATRALESSEQRARHVTATSLVSRAIATSRQPEEAFRAMTGREVRDSLTLDGLVLAPLTDPPLFEEQGEWDEDRPELRAALVGDVAATGMEMVLHGDSRQLLPRGLARLADLQAVAAAIPFGVGSDPPLGVLLAWRGHRQSRRTRFDVAELSVLHTLADYAALSLESARLLREVGDADTLRAMAALKDEFVGQVSHELRTPLTIVHGYAELIVSRRLRDREAIYKAVEEIFASSSSMLRLVGDLLDTSRLESGRLVLDLVELDLAPWLSKTVAAFAQTSPSHNIVAEIPTMLPLVRADEVRLGQVLHNLLTNALRYSPAGSDIRVIARQSADEVDIQVHDEGVGIPPEEQDRVFQKFFRGKDGIALATRGAGLGLAVAKALMEAHRGAISVTSVAGEGSTFTMHLPTIGSTLSLGLSPSGEYGAVSNGAFARSPVR